MIKKTLMWVVLAAFVGVLVAGGVIRTWDRMAQTAEARGVGQGDAVGANRRGDRSGSGYGEGRGRQSAEGGDESHGDCAGSGKGASTDRGQGNGGAIATDSDHAGEWRSVSGVVASVDDTEMAVHATDGTVVLVEGMPWKFALESGFAAATGDEVSLTGFDEDGELKTGQIANDTTGQNVTLRDESGRPGWAGRGRGQGRG